MTLAQLDTQFLTPARNEAVGRAVALARQRRRVEFRGLAGSSAAMLLAAINPPQTETPEKHAKAAKAAKSAKSATSEQEFRGAVVVADTLDDAGYLYQDLARLMGEQAVMILPSGYKRDIKFGRPDPPQQILRTEVLSHWGADTRLRYVVTYPEALAERVAPPESIEAATMRVAVGETLDLAKATRWLADNGFKEVDYVYEPGHFAVRGSILDIFGYSSELPYRVDLFGDDVESVRTFNIETQLSEQRLPWATVTANLSRQAAEGASPKSFLDFIAPDTMLFMRDQAWVAERVRAVCSQEFSPSALITGDGDAHAMEQLVDADAFARSIERFPKIYLSPAGGTREGQEGDEGQQEPQEQRVPQERQMPQALKSCADAVVDFQCSPQGLYHKNFDLISESFSKLIKEGYTIFILSDSDKQAERLRAIFDERGDTGITFTPVEATLHEGFTDHATRRCVFTDHQVFDRFHKYTLRSDRARSGKLALSLKELQAIEPGDFIVHVDHGVGRFGGLLRTRVNGCTQEMIKLVYKNNDCIFVSIHSLHKLAKYRGKEGVEPQVNRLGSGAWNKLKEKTKSKLKDIARDLIRLYASRRQEAGFAFAPDSYLQHELEASFLYEDTPDQAAATAAVKKDMETDRPMDRLVCGDVGFGKTEVAIRAAFKAATDGKQVAVLVPTTVLAYQHFNTFTERLRDFPVRVDYLSRARTPKQVKAILSDLAEGKIDILIGTHRLVGKDVRFKDLGLLVIDEEQKFGVATKEKLKQLKTSVDTLTMSATPIPRTLQFSLMGARDLSNINTPPPNRHPILTSVNTLTDELLAEAVGFEMSRNGQTFIVNNRIEGLYALEQQVKRVIPDARTLVAHGQMPPDQLEKAIIDFANHDYDVLLATTIIESGIDMPNVNTIIVNNAQNFGLSELHQLRGRVGRAARKAFCYLMVPPGVPLTPVAQRRLQAIESFADLGSGIHIAMQDLDIRGAGNLLGAEQSGFIADLGYETYQKILKEAVTELRTEEFADTFSDEASASPAGGDGGEDFVADCVIESDLELLLPATYVPSESERIALYRELDGMEREMDILDFGKRLEDRFGKIPRETAELMRVPRLRRLARRLGVEKVVLKGGLMYLYFVGSDNQAYYQSPMFGRLIAFLQKYPQRVKIRQNNATDRRSFSVADVPNVETAVSLLQEVLSLPAA